MTADIQNGSGVVKRREAAERDTDPNGRPAKKAPNVWASLHYMVGATMFLELSHPYPAGGTMSDVLSPVGQTGSIHGSSKEPIETALQVGAGVTKC